MIYIFQEICLYTSIVNRHSRSVCVCQSGNLCIQSILFMEAYAHRLCCFLSFGIAGSWIQLVYKSVSILIEEFLSFIRLSVDLSGGNKEISFCIFLFCKLQCFKCSNCVCSNCLYRLVLHNERTCRTCCMDNIINISDIRDIFCYISYYNIHIFTVSDLFRKFIYISHNSIYFNAIMLLIVEHQEYI